jgi:hypothetical protein
LKNKGHKRLNFLINKKFQLKFILYTLIPTVVCLSIFYVSLSIYFSKLIELGKNSGLEANHSYFILIADQQKLMNAMFISSSLFSFIFFIVWGVFISHKIAGPLYRLTRFFEETDASHFSERLAFRPNDLFQEIPLAINRWMDKNHRS